MLSVMTVSLMPGSEYRALENFLDAQRIGIIRKVEAISGGLARQTPNVSSLSLVGLIKRSVTCEQRWFQVIMAGLPSPDRWPEVKPEPHVAELVIVDSDTVSHWFALGRTGSHWVAVYREQIAKSHAIAASSDLDDRCVRTDVTECNVRYVLLHMIAETARHAGHADIIRETFEVVHGEERVSFFAQLVRLHHAGARARGQ